MADVLQEFLVSLGYRVDPAQQSRFNEAVESSQKKIGDFNKTLIDVADRLAHVATLATGAGVGIAAAMDKIGHQLSGLAYSAERIGSTPERVNAFENTMKMLGGTAEQARASLEGVARVQRTNPGILQALFGIKPGTDTVDAMRQIGVRFNELIKQGPMGMAQALAMAQQLGLDQAEVLRLASNNFGRFYDESAQRVRRWGSDMDQAAKLAQQQEQDLTRLQEHWQGFTTYLYQTFGPSYVHALDVVNDWFDTNAPKVKTHIDNLKGDFDGLTKGLSDAFSSLSPGQKSGLEIGATVGGGLIASRAAGSIMGRLGGMVGLGGIGKMGSMALFATVLGGLVNDYETWKQDRNQSFIDWDRWSPGIEKATSALQAFNTDVMNPLAEKLGVPKEIIPAFEALATYMAGQWLGKMVFSFSKAESSALGFWGRINVLLVALGALNKALDPETFDPKNWSSDSPFWRGMSDEEQRKYPNSPLMQSQSGGGGPAPSFWESPWDWTKRRLGFGPTNGGGATDQRKAQIRDQLASDLGISPTAASGIVSNLNAESGIQGINEKNPVVPGSRGGFGWAQWTGSRRRDFEAWAAKRGLDPSSDEANYGFLVDELKNRYPAILAQLRSGKISATEAANIFFAYESGGAAELEKNRAGHVGQAESISKLPASGQAMKPNPAGTNLATPPPGLMGGEALPTQPEMQQMSQANDNSRQVHIADNSVTNITGVSDPDRVGRITRENRDRANANMVRHIGNTVA